MPEYYRATDLPVPHTTADANRIARNLRAIADSFAMLPSPAALRDGLSTYYTAIAGDVGDTDVSGGPATSEGVAGAVGGTAVGGTPGVRGDATGPASGASSGPAEGTAADSTTPVEGTATEDSPNAWSVAPDTALPPQSDPNEPYEDDQEVTFDAPAGNTGPLMLDVDGRGSVPVVQQDGTPLASGDIPSGTTVTVQYDAEEDHFTVATEDWTVTPTTPLPPQSDPQQPYTKALLAAVPRLGSMSHTDEPAKFPLVDAGSL